MIFVGVQVYEYYELFHKGALPSTDIFWSTFYVMTGFHGLHVIVGLIWLIAVWFAAWRGHYTKENHLGVELAGLYFEADVSGSFELDADAGLESCKLDVVWSLGVRFAGNEGQIYPLASQAPIKPA